LLCPVLAYAVKFKNLKTGMGRLVLIEHPLALLRIIEVVGVYKVVVLCGFVYRNILHLFCNSKNFAGNFVPLLELGHTGQAEVIRAAFEIFTQVVSINNVDHHSTLFAALLNRRWNSTEKARRANSGLFLFIKRPPLSGLATLGAYLVCSTCLVNLRHESFSHPRLPY